MASVATKIFQELVEGVFYIHNMGIVHRDLKVRNWVLQGKVFEHFDSQTSAL